MPDRIPSLRPEEILALKNRPYTEAALLVGWSFLQGEIGKDALRRIVEDAYDYDVPLEPVTGRKFLMRLDRGPTASFKDFAARMMAAS